MKLIVNNKWVTNLKYICMKILRAKKRMKVGDKGVFRN